MPRVRIKTGLNQVQLPNGRSYDAGDVVELTDAEFDQLAATALGDEVIVVSDTVDIYGTTEFFYAHLPFQLANVVNGDVAAFTPGFAGRVVATRFLVDDVGAGAGATTALNLEIGTTNVTGGVVTPTLANTTPKGTVVAGTAVTAANVFDADDVLTLEAAATTPFTGGSGVLEVLLEKTA